MDIMQLRVGMVVTERDEGRFARHLKVVDILGWKENIHEESYYCVKFSYMEGDEVKFVELEDFYDEDEKCFHFSFFVV